MSDPGSGRRQWRPLLLFVIFALAFFRFWNHSIIFRDSFQYFAPEKFLIAAALKSGTIWTWNPWQFCGMPLVADIQAGWFYPLNLIYLALPFEPAHRFFILLHYPLAGLFMCLFLRGRGLSGNAAFLGGLVFPFSGYLISQHSNLTFLIGPAWAPLGLYFLDRAFDRAGAWALACAAVLGLQIFGGEPQSAALTAGLVVGIAFGRGLAEARSGRAAGIVAVTGLAALALSAVQVLPTFEMIRLSIRQAGFSLAQTEGFSFHPARLIELIWPAPFGGVAPDFHYWGDFFLEPAMRGIKQTPWSLTEYLGLPVLALAVISAAASRRRWKWWPAGGMVVFLLISLGRHTPVWGWLYQFGFVFRVFRYPEKYMAWFTLATAMAAALGFEQIEEWAREKPRVLLKLGLGYVALTLIGAALAAVDWPTVIRMFSGLLEGSPEMAIARHNLFLGGVEWLALNLIVSVLLLIAGKNIFAPKKLAIVFFAALVLDFFFANVTTMPTGPTDIYTFPQALTKALGQEGRPALGRFRIFRAPIIFQDSDPALAGHFGQFERQRIFERNTLIENLHAMAGFEHIFGYYYSDPAAGRELFKGELSPRQLLPYNVEYVIASFQPKPITETAAEVVFRDQANDVTVTRMPEAFPRAYWVGEARRAKDEQEAISLFSTTDLRRTVIITTDEAIESRLVENSALIPATVVRYEPDEVELKCRAPVAGWLVLSDRYYPGWTAAVDGRPATIYQANVFVRAVKVEPGEHAVRFVFRSRSLRLGAWISGPAWAILLIGGAAAFIRKFFSKAPAIRAG